MDNKAPMLGHIERIEYGEGFLFLEGWIASTRSGSKADPVTIRVDGLHPITVSQFTFRSDLRDAGISNGESGIFCLIRTGKTFIDCPPVYASRNGSDELVITSVGTVFTPFKPRGAIDRESESEITGWIFDPISKSDAKITVDERVDVPITSRFDRKDLPFDHLVEPGCGFLVAKDAIAKEIFRGGAVTHDKKQHAAQLISRNIVVDTRQIDLKFFKISKIRAPVDIPTKGTKAEVVASRKEQEGKPKSPALSVRIERVVSGEKRMAVVGWAALSTNQAITSPLDFKFNTGESVTVGALDHRADLAQKGVAGGFAAFTIILDVSTGSPCKEVAVSIRGTDLNAVSKVPDVTHADSTVISSVKGDEKFISGVFLDLNSSVSRNAVLLIDDRYKVDVPISGEPTEKRFWGVNDGIPANFQISTRELLHKLRGQNPEVIFSANKKVPVGVGGARAMVALRKKSRGNLEKATSELISGWLVTEESDGIAEFDIYVNGTRYLTGKADRPRADLVQKKVTKRGGGFRIDTKNLFIDADLAEINVGPAYTKDFLSQTPKQITIENRVANRVDNSFAILTTAQKRKISVIIPVYNAYDDLILCLTSLVRHTQSIGDVILIDDYSPDTRIKQILAGYEGRRGFRVFYNEENLGFTRTVNRGIDLAGDNDVVFLNSDTIVSEGWLQGLRSAAYSAPNIATATALSNNSGVYSVPEMNVDNAFPANFEVDDVARTVRQASMGIYPRVPTGNGFCMYVRRDCINQIGALDETAFPVGYGEENDFCMRALRAGFEHVCDDRTFVYHKRSASFGESKSEHYARGRETLRSRYPEYRKMTQVFETGPEMLAVRWQVRNAMIGSAKTADRPRPRVAFVISTQTGGTPQTNRDLMAALVDRYEPWVIRCDSQKIEVYKFNGQIEELVSTKLLRTQITPTTHKSGEYDEEIFRILKRHAFELVHIRHLGWHGLGLPRVCKLLDIPVVISFHDFYAACPTIKLLDENRIYCGGQCTSTDGDCSVELWDQALFPTLKHQFIRRWREMFAETFESCDAFVTTSERAKEVLLNAFPKELGRAFNVIPHGRTFERSYRHGVVPEQSERLRVLVPGNISPAKGADLIREMLSLDELKRVEFHILGDHGRLTPQEGLILHGLYKRHEFGERVRQIRPHIGAVLSIWPETYCHTLTEMWSSGIPVVGIDLGAVGERIAAHGGGWLVPKEAGADQMLSLLVAIKDNVSDLRSKFQQISEWQEGYGKVYDTNYMGMKYDSLYRKVRRENLSLVDLKEDHRISETAIIAPIEKPEVSELVKRYYSNNYSGSQIFWNAFSDFQALALDFVTVDAAIVFADALRPGDGAKLASIAQDKKIELHIVAQDKALLEHDGLFGSGQKSESDVSVVRIAKSLLVGSESMLDWALRINKNSKVFVPER